MSPPSATGQGVGSSARSEYRGTGYRHQSPGHDPLSGEGARINGGRFNPPDSFPVLYLCVSRDCAVAEFERLGDTHVIGAAGLLPRELYEYRIELASVLDLTSSTARNVMGVTEAQLVAPDWRICQAIGEKAHTAGFQAILAPSATGVDEVLAVFPEKVGNRGRLEARMEELWVSTADLHRPR